MPNFSIHVLHSPNKINTQIKQNHVSEDQIENQFQYDQNQFIFNENNDFCDQNEPTNEKKFIFQNDHINQKMYLNKGKTYSKNNKSELKEFKYAHNQQQNKFALIVTLLFIIFLIFAAIGVVYAYFEYNLKRSDQTMNFRINENVTLSNEYKQSEQYVLNKEVDFEAVQINNQINGNIEKIVNLKKQIKQQEHQDFQINSAQRTALSNLNQLAESASLQNQNPVIQNKSLQYIKNSQNSTIPSINTPLQFKKSELINSNPNVQSQIKEDENENYSSLNCDQYLKSQQSKYGRLYTFNCPNQMFRKNSNADHYSQTVTTNCSSIQYSQAIDLLDIIHHIDQSGNIIARNTPCQTAQNTVKRLNDTLERQYKRLDNTYQISKYHPQQLRFCIVVNSYRNAQSGLLYRNIDSILQQNYTNYHVVYTDDFSPDRTGQIVKEYLNNKSIPSDKIKVKINSQKKGMMENIYNAVVEDCQTGEIVVMLDGDDSFIGVNVLSFLNAVYQKQKLAMMWNNFIQINSNQRAIMGFSRQYREAQQIIGGHRTIKFVSSHLKSFYVDLFKRIKVSDLQQPDGTFFGGASDTAMMFAMIEMSNPRFKYVPEIMYEYRTDTGQLGMVTNRQPQHRALTKIQITEPYKPLDDFSFIDKAMQKLN